MNFESDMYIIDIRGYGSYISCYRLARRCIQRVNSLPQGSSNTVEQMFGADSAVLWHL